MRLSMSYRAIRAKGFFISHQFFFYKRRVLGYYAPFGVGTRASQLLRLLGEGGITRMVIKDARYYQTNLRRWQNSGLLLLRFISVIVDPVRPAAWALLRFLRIRHIRGLRYRLGLPSGGQRTHTNAATTRRMRNPVVAYLQTYY